MRPHSMGYPRSASRRTQRPTASLGQGLDELPLSHAHEDLVLGSISGSFSPGPQAHSASFEPGYPGG
jgi:hypothetical protein